MFECFGSVCGCGRLIQFGVRRLARLVFLEKRSLSFAADVHLAFCPFVFSWILLDYQLIYRALFPSELLLSRPVLTIPLSHSSLPAFKWQAPLQQSPPRPTHLPAHLSHHTSSPKSQMRSVSRHPAQIRVRCQAQRDMRAEVHPQPVHVSTFTRPNGSSTSFLHHISLRQHPHPCF